MGCNYLQIADLEFVDVSASPSLVFKRLPTILRLGVTILKSTSSLAPLYQKSSEEPSASLSSYFEQLSDRPR
jgi:hypothetical protein